MYQLEINLVWEIEDLATKNKMKTDKIGSNGFSGITRANMSVCRIYNFSVSELTSERTQTPGKIYYYYVYYYSVCSIWLVHGSLSAVK